MTDRSLGYDALYGEIDWMAATDKPGPGPGVEDMARMAQALSESWRFGGMQRLKELEQRVAALERLHKEPTPEAPRPIASPTEADLIEQRDEARQVARQMLALYDDTRRFRDERERWESDYPWLKREAEPCAR